MKKIPPPKHPVEPRKPIIPKPPSKTVEVSHSISIDHPFTVTQLLAKIPENIGHDKVTIELETDYAYDGLESYSELKVYYIETKDNKFYDKEYNKYQLKLKKHNIKLFEYREDHKEYLIKYTKYLEDKKIYDEYVSKKEYDDALKIVNAFKKKVRPVC